MEIELEPLSRADDLTRQQLAELCARGPQPERYGVAEFHDEIADIEEPRRDACQRSWYPDLKSACARGLCGRPGGPRPEARSRKMWRSSTCSCSSRADRPEHRVPNERCQEQEIDVKSPPI